MGKVTKRERKKNEEDFSTTLVSKFFLTQPKPSLVRNPFVFFFFTFRVAQRYKCQSPLHPSSYSWERGNGREMANMQIVPASKNVEAQYVEMKVPLYSYGCEKKVRKALLQLKGRFLYHIVSFACRGIFINFPSTYQETEIVMRFWHEWYWPIATFCLLRGRPTLILTEWWPHIWVGVLIGPTR